jgi:hypothetical protein
MLLLPQRYMLSIMVACTGLLCIVLRVLRCGGGLLQHKTAGEFGR